MPAKKEPGEGMTVDIKLVRDLAAILEKAGLSEIEVEDGDSKIKVARGGGGGTYISAPVPEPAAPAAPAAAPAVSGSASAGAWRGGAQCPSSTLDEQARRCKPPPCSAGAPPFSLEWRVPCCSLSASSCTPYSWASSINGFEQQHHKERNKQN